MHGPKLSEGIITSYEYGYYDEKLKQLWGGPMPRAFLVAWETWPEKYKAACKGKVAVVTGGAAGIGFYISKLLARLGCTVIIPWRKGLEHETDAAVREIRKATGASDEHVRASVNPLDLGSFASVRAFAGGLKTSLKESAIDFLCLNAGRGGSSGDPLEFTDDGVEKIMQINALGHFLLVSELLPLLRSKSNGHGKKKSTAAVAASASASRIVSQSSGARRLWKELSLVPHRMRRDLSHRTTIGDYGKKLKFDAWSQYCLSKAACCFTTIGLNARLAQAGIDDIIALTTDPGFACTGVNVQHNLGHSLLGAFDGLLSTTLLHDVAGHHAADGALSHVLACVHPDPPRDAFFCPAEKNGTVGAPRLATHEDLGPLGDAGGAEKAESMIMQWKKDPVLSAEQGSMWRWLRAVESSPMYERSEDDWPRCAQRQRVEHDTTRDYFWEGACEATGATFKHFF